jgi:hypothetical protein
MIEVFKTDVEQRAQATMLVAALLEHFPQSRINVDLQDCDKVLRIEGKDFHSDTVMRIVKEHGFACAMLEA